MKQSASVQIIIIMLVALVTIAASAWITWRMIDGDRTATTATQSADSPHHRKGSPGPSDAEGLNR